MSETQPYRLFKEFLDTIVQMPKNIKKKLADEFERRRLEIQEKKLQEEPENKSWFPSQENKSQEEPENKSWFPSQENKSQEEPENKSWFPSQENKSQEEPENKSWFPSQENKSQEEPENKSFFDSIFSKQQTDDMMDKFSKTPSTLSMALKHKCQIRPW
jgi:hypothetical protein